MANQRIRSQHLCFRVAAAESPDRDNTQSALHIFYMQGKFNLGSAGGFVQIMMPLYGSGQIMWLGGAALMIGSMQPPIQMSICSRCQETIRFFWTFCLRDAVGVRLPGVGSIEMSPNSGHKIPYTKCTAVAT